MLKSSFFIFLLIFSFSAIASPADIKIKRYLHSQSFLINNLYSTQKAVAKNLNYLDKYFEEEEMEFESSLKPRVALISTERFNKIVDVSPVFGVSIKY